MEEILSKSTIGLRRSGLAALATTSLVMGAIFAGAGVANADADFDFTRVAGDDRYETSADIAGQFGAATTAILASGEPGHYPDALSANYLAGLKDAPVLLTTLDETPQSVKDRLAAAGVENVIIVGGELAVSAAQEDALAEDYNVSRLSGQNRFDTNADIIGEGSDDETSDTALIATGLAFPDALAGGPVAFHEGMPIGLSSGADMPDQVIEALKGAGVNKAIVLGGENAVPQSVVDELEGNGIDFVTRLEGRSRSLTAKQIADYAVENFGFVDTAANVASGRSFGDGADALAGGPLTGQQVRPLLITENENIAGGAADYLEENANTLTEGLIFGGNLAISQALENELEDAAQATTTNQSYTATPAEAATNQVSSSAIDNTGRRAYSVSGLEAGKTYNVALAPAETVSNTAGTVKFSDATKVGQTDARIEVVNGALTDGSDQQTATAQSDGTITFTVDSQAVDQVIPVVWQDAEATGDRALDLNADGTPSEKFAIAGQKNWISAEAGAGAPTGDVTVSLVNREADYFLGNDTAADETYNYDNNDVFRLNGVAISMSQFEGLLTKDDVIDGATSSYDPDVADTSIFNVQTDTVAAPTGLKVTMSDLDADGTADDATLTWTASTQPDAIYNVYTGSAADGFGAGDTAVKENLTGTSTTINNAAGTTYIVGAEGSTSGARSTNDPSVAAATPVDAAPAVNANGALVDVDDDSDNATSNGDVWKFHLSEPVTVASDAAIQLTNASGPVFENGVNATFALNAAGDVLTVTLGGTPAATAYTATIHDIQGIRDADEGNKALAFAGDTALDNNGVEVLSNTFEAAAGKTTATVTFNEDLIQVSAENEGNYTFTSADLTGAQNLVSAVLGADGRTVTFTFDGALGTGDTLDILATLLDTDGQGATPDTLTVS